MRRWVGAGVVLLSVWCVAGCGGSGRARPSEATVPATSHAGQTAVRTAVAAARNTSERIRESLDLTSQGHTYHLTVTGAFDMAGDKGTLAVDFPGGAISHLDEIFTGGEVYVRGLSEAGSGWADVPRDQAESHYILRAPLNDPEYLLEQIGAMQDVFPGAPEQVDGVHAAHYRGSLGFAAATRRMASATRSQLTDMKQAFGSTLVDADAWIGSDGKLVRTRTSFHVQDITATMTLTLSDAGLPVKAQAPPAAKVIPAASVSGVLVG